MKSNFSKFFHFSKIKECYIRLLYKEMMHTLRCLKSFSACRQRFQFLTHSYLTHFYLFSVCNLQIKVSDFHTFLFNQFLTYSFFCSFTAKNIRKKILRYSSMNGRQLLLQNKSKCFYSYEMTQSDKPPFHNVAASWCSGHHYCTTLFN